MAGPIDRFLSEDHARLDALLRQTVADPSSVDVVPYERFRAGLLRHISMEEKVLLPAARRLRGGEPLAIARQLRADHGALAALLVPTPTPAIISAIRDVLEAHNPLEEGPDGVYAECERLAGPEVQQLLARMNEVPEVPLAPHVDGPRVHEHLANLLRARQH